MNEPEGLFREEAVKSSVTDKNFGDMLVVVSPKGWVALSTIVTLIVLILIWSLIGSIPDSVEGSGFILSGKRNFVVQTEEEGVIEEIYVKKGEVIEAGQLLVRLKNDFIDLEVKESIKNKELILSQQVAFTSQDSKKMGLESLFEKQVFETRLREAQSRIDEALLRQEKLKIYSPFSGVALSVPVATQDYVEKGRKLVWAEESKEGTLDQVIYGYFSSESAQKIKQGMISQVKLNNVAYKKYGELIAVVDSVWDYPISAEELYNVIGNHEVARSITKGGTLAPIQVVLKPLKDPSTATGYRWTSDRGPPDPIRSGVIVTVDVMIRQIRPIEFMFPIYRSFKESINLRKAQEELKCR